jgi:hypothetical protein
MISFKAKIYKQGINPCVDVPKKVSEQFNKRGYVPIKGTVNSFKFKSTLVPMGRGRHRLFVNGGMRKGAGVGLGDTIDVSLVFDKASRKVPMPRYLRTALEKNGVYDVFRTLTPSKRKDIYVYLAHLKKRETRENNVRRIVGKLKKGDHRL